MLEKVVSFRRSVRTRNTSSNIFSYVLTTELANFYKRVIQAGSYQVVHMVQCTTNNSSYHWELVQCTTKNFDATVKKWGKIKPNITKKKCIL